MKRSKPLSKLNILLTARPIPALAADAAMTELLLELLGHRRPLEAFVFIYRNPLMFLLDASIIFVTLLPVLFLRRKVFYSVLVTMVWLICGIVSCVMLAVRSTPFSARDFSLLASGLLIADVYLSPLAIAGICLGVAALIALAILLFIRAPRAEKQSNLKKKLLTAAAIASALAIAAYFGTRKIDLSKQYESVNEAYEKNGFPYCFLASIVESGVDRPENYSEDEVNDLAIDEPVEAPKQPNIILIQLESFFDPALIRGLDLKEDPIPNFTGLRDSCASGYLRVPTLGAGTVNAEFEVLTGMSLDYFGLNEYPYESILRENTCESIAYYLKDLGYRTHAVHNYAGSFYGRNQVYPNLGFDDYTSVEYMQDVEFTETEWPKDKILTKYILQAMEKTETPDFVFAVSVQCHGKYLDENRVDDIHLRSNDVFDESASEQFLYYTRQLQGTDQFLGELIDALKASNEAAVVVAYGDHLPNLDLEEEDMLNGSLFQTQYFIWSNYGVGVGGRDEDLSAYQLTAHLFDVIGMNGGVVTEYHSEHKNDADYQKVLEMLEYDLLYGDRAAYGGTSPYTKTEMKMGLENIFVNEIVFTKSQVEILGSGFTKNSIVYADGERCEDTVFVSPEKLTVDNSGGNITPEMGIDVCQTGADRIILSTAVRR